MSTFVKFRFNSEQHGPTAGLVLDSDKFKAMDLPEISYLYPVSEAPKMKRFQVSPIYPTWEAAFNHDFA